MNFYEDFLKNQKKNSQVNNGLADTWQKLKPTLPKNAPKTQTQTTEKQTITSSAPKISNAISIFPKGQSFVAPRKPKTLIGNRNAKNEIVKLPYKPDTLNGKLKISKLPYKPYEPNTLNGNSGFGKRPDFNREEPKIDKGFTKFPNYTREGLRIKGNILDILKKHLGELDSRHIFDGIDDDTIERNKPVAQAAIEDNVRKGLLTQEQLEKYPNMLDAMTMFYAAGEKGKPKAQNLARSVAYSDGKYPDIIPTDIMLLSNDITATEVDSLRTSDDVVVQNNNAGKRYVGADGVRIRNGYGLGATAMGQLNEGDEVEYTGRKTSEEIDGHYWAEIVHDGKTYWIAADYLRMESLGNMANNYDMEHRDSVSDTNSDSIVEEKSIKTGMSNETTDNRIYYGDYWNGKPHEDLEYGDLDKEKLCSMEWINWSDFLSTEIDHLSNLINLGEATSKWKMSEIVYDMIRHFADGSGTDYVNEKLTNIVKEHEVTQAFMKDFTKVFEEQLQLHNGDISKFANSEAFKQALRDNEVYITSYAYEGLDTFTGLTMAIHGWTESKVDITSFNVNSDGSYSANLRFTFMDNFGLDEKDIQKFGAIRGFRSWYILQHYSKYNGKYKPFKTVVTIDYPISGKLMEEN